MPYSHSFSFFRGLDHHSQGPHLLTTVSRTHLGRNDVIEVLYYCLLLEGNKSNPKIIEVEVHS